MKFLSRSEVGVHIANPYHFSGEETEIQTKCSKLPIESKEPQNSTASPLSHSPIFVLTY